eukprot:scaffold338872_cov49-Prasinocladus_malaysianus.AAC.1
MLSTTREFRGGPIEIPAVLHPKLGLDWTMTVRLAMKNPKDPLPRKRLILRKYIGGDTSGKSCWAWYSWVSPWCLRLKQRCPPQHTVPWQGGMTKFVFEYGQHNIDDGYPMLVFDIKQDQPGLTTDPAAFNL